MTSRFTAFSRYSRWDGSQRINEPEAEQILAAMSDDLMEYGDLQQAMRYLMQRGIDNRNDGHIRGLRELLKQLREQRRQRLERYDLGGIMEQIRRQLDEILDMERASIRQWPNRQSPADGSDEPIPGRQQPAQNNPTADDRPAANSADNPANNTDESADNDFSRKLLGDIARRNQQFIDNLPMDTAGRISALQKYEFLSPDAQRRFLKLIDQLRKAMAGSFFRDVEKMVREMSDGDIERMKDMIRALNDMLVKKIAGEDPGFEQFMERFGDMFGDPPPQSLDDLLDQMQRQMAATQSLLASLPPDQQQQLQSMLGDKFGDPQLNAELAKLAKELDFLLPDGKRYQFHGDESIDLQAAMQLMRQMGELDDLEQQLQQAQYDGNMDSIDPQAVRELLGDEAADNLEEMKKLLEILENAGYVRRDGEKWELTPRGTRTLGQKALGEIYRQLKKHDMGNHAIPEEGRFGERTEDPKPYEFGDPFHLHMPRTIRNAIDREGPQTPVRLRTADFEVHRSELITQTATVLMVDLSWSMALRGSFKSAKKVALALHNLISTAYPRDSLYVLGFSAHAKQIKPHDLPYLQYDDYLLGTNMQHALILAEKLLAKHHQGTRQIIMITDGEPTAHLENGRPVFAYPPTPTTINRTLKAIRMCARKNITINTFMLDQSHSLKAFVEQMTQINGGRVFYTTSHNLGEYILVDYVQHKRKKLAGNHRQ